MSKKSFILVIVLGFVLFSCERDDFQDDVIYSKQMTINPEDYNQGHLRIKISEKLSKSFELFTDSNGVLTSTIDKSVNEAFNLINLKYMTRTFPYAGRFEARTRKEGLHLWYDVYYDESIHLTKANGALSEIEGVDEVEFRPKIYRIASDYLKVVEVINNNISKSLPFNDPLLSQQWHYNNDGSSSNSVAGSDINVFPVWKNFTTGNSDVIVSIVDGGIDYEHEDLAGNIWINQAEFNGSTGVDDDKNGFVDDIRGFNFIYNTGLITPENHGTHVAGTVGAVNNNGKGVSGVAGGDFANNIKGVRLMSCQIFESGSNRSGNGAAAIKYGADNGAVISQNSWGYLNGTSTSSSDKAAIDYFRNYAGINEHGVQVGPMKGGIVIFAAGNDNKEIGFPAEYEGAFAVASLAQDYMRAYYSNYGTWVDISAPGGDAQKGGLILSTITGNRYGTMQGTSMACPHVSGVAALIVSQFGGPGFTNDMLWNRLVSTTKDIEPYNRSLAGKLGTGLVNTFGAMASSSTIPPNPVTDLSGIASSNTIDLQWTVPTDPDDYKPYGFTVYYSENSLGSFNRTNFQGVSSASFNTGDLDPGQDFTAKISNLEFETDYFFVVDAYDFSSNRSELSGQISIKTLSNNSPVINPLDGTSAYIKAYQTSVLRFTYTDTDNHPMTWSFIPGSQAANAVQLDGIIQVRIVGKDAPAGSYQAKLTVTDMYGAFDEIIVTYTIAENIPPEVISDMDDVVMGAAGRKLTFNLNEFFVDGDGELLTFSIQSSVPSVVHIVASGGLLYISAIRLGLTEVIITASDVLGESCSTSFKVLVRDENQEIDIFPNPVVNTLKLRMGVETSADVSIIGSSGAKVFDSNLVLSPFVPAQIDMSKMSGGVYTVIVKYEGKELKSNIVKL